MSEPSKLTAAHLRRAAIIYIRQSSPSQLERNRESTDRQYALAERAVVLGWPRQAVRVIDADLGVSGASAAARSGFGELTEQVGLGRVGVVLALEVSRLARNNSDWYRLLDLAGMTNTLIGDADGLYHPGMFNDRMLLGLKGTMSEAELHVLRTRLDGGIRNKAARGELRRPLPVGLIWDTTDNRTDGQIRLHPDQAITGVLAAIFERFTVCGSARGVWLWLREQGLSFPLVRHGYTGVSDEITWVAPTYHAVHNVLTHPAYAGAYVFGRTRAERYVGEDGVLRTRRRRLAQPDWGVLITDHHPGFIDWDTYQANQARIGANTRPREHQAGTGAVREGAALLQGLAICGNCGRKLAVYYDGPHKATPGYYCTGSGQLVDGKGARHLRVGGSGIDAAVTEAFLAALAPAALQACLAAAARIEDGHDTALAQWRREVERARYTTDKAERRYRAVDPENRLVARGLEADWETALSALAAAQAELDRREAARPKALSADERAAVLALGDDLDTVWTAPTTTDRDRKQLLRTLLDEVNISVQRDHGHGQAQLLLRWKGGAISEVTAPLRRKPRRSAPTKPPSPSCAASPSTTPTRRSPESSTGKVGAPPENCRSPPVGSSRYAITGTFPATSPVTIRRKENCSPWPTPPPNSASPPPPCTAGSATGSLNRPGFTTSGGRMHPSQLWELVRRLAATAGISEWDRLSAHSLRHTGITMALDAGVLLRDVQDYARHRDARTTRRYDHSRDNLGRSAAYAVAAYLA